MRIICLFFLLLISGYLSASEISIGRTNIEIPNPEGFVAVTPKMVSLYEFQKQFVVPSNVEFRGFITEKDVPTALKDEIPELQKRLAVQTTKSLVNMSVSKADFAKIKEKIKLQHNEILKKAESAISKAMGMVNSNLNENYDVDFALSVTRIVPLPIHGETDHTLAFSTYVKYDMKDEAGNPTQFITLVTATYVHVKGKVLILYSNAEESALDWSKKMSTQWANAIINANPSNLIGNKLAQ